MKTVDKYYHEVVKTVYHTNRGKSVGVYETVLGRFLDYDKARMFSDKKSLEWRNKLADENEHWIFHISPIDIPLDESTNLDFDAELSNCFSKSGFDEAVCIEVIEYKLDDDRYDKNGNEILEEKI